MGCLSDCAVGVVRIILFIFNFLIFVCAVCLIVLGGLIQYNNTGYDVSAISIFAIVLGSFIGLIAFFGCCGACKGNTCLLTTYAAILITLFIIQLVLGVLIFISIQKSDDAEADFKGKLKTHLQDLYNSYKIKDADAITIIDDLQQRYECCGVTGKDDPYAALTATTLIPSCCEDFDKDKSTTCGRYAENAYNKGCLEELYDFLDMLASAAGGIAIGFGVLELVAAIFAFCVRNHYNNKRHATY